MPKVESPGHPGHPPPLSDAVVKQGLFNTGLFNTVKNEEHRRGQQSLV